MSKKKTCDFIFSFIFFMIIVSYILMLFIVPSEIAFCDSAAVFVKSDVNIFLVIVGILFLIINTAVYLDMLKKKIFKISNLSGKQLSVQKKHPRKIHKDLIIGIVLYFLLSNFIILYATLDALFPRYTLTKYEVAYYNLLNQKTQKYDLKNFNNFELGTQVYSSRTGTSMHFCIETDGPVNLSFMKIHNRKQALELMAKLKESYNTKIDKNDIRLFQRKSGYTSWTIEERELFSSIFDL